MLRVPKHSGFFWSLALINVLAWSWIYSYSPGGQIYPAILSSMAPVPYTSSSPVMLAADTVVEQTPLAAGIEPEPITISIIMLDEAAALDGTVTLKSALMHTSRPVTFHIICSEDAIPIIEARFRLLPQPAHPVKAFYYPVTKEFILERCERAGTGYDYKLLVKAFLHELVHPSVEKTILVDVDMIFAVDPLLLWNEFEKMRPQQLVAFPVVDYKSYAGQSAMLLKLDSLRDPSALFMPSTLLSFTESTSIAARAFALAEVDRAPMRDGTTGSSHAYAALIGSQGVYHFVWLYYRDLFMHLSLRWDITNCRSSFGLRLGGKNETDSAGDDTLTEEEQIERQILLEGSPEEGQLVIPGILHFGCQEDAGASVWRPHGDAMNSTWGHMVSVAKHYQWAWLNRGDGSAKVSTKRLSNVRWWDEVLSERMSDGTRMSDNLDE